MTDWRSDLKARYPNQVRCVPECWDGWRPIVESAVDLILAAAPAAKIVEIKEKYGTLRICCDAPPAATKQIDRITAAAEAESERTCEICGQPGALYDIDDWLATRCVEHSQWRQGTS